MLREQLLNKKARFGSTFRAIIFVQQRITAHVISNFINNDIEMQHLDIKAGYIASRGSKITPSIKVTPFIAKENIVRFRNVDQMLSLQHQLLRRVLMCQQQTWSSALIT